MRITLTARVDLGTGWDQHNVSKDIQIELEHLDDAPLFPWAQICAGLVEATIKARLETDDSDPEDNET